VSESSPPRQVKNEVRAMKALIEVFEERYGIATVKPEYVIGPKYMWKARHVHFLSVMKFCTVARQIP
jgi:hypothetical protein